MLSHKEMDPFQYLGIEAEGSVEVGSCQMPKSQCCVQVYIKITRKELQIKTYTSRYTKIQ